MSLSVERLLPEIETEYDNFIKSIPRALFYSSIGYRNLLKHFLAAEDYYFVARNQAGRIVGVLPSFIKDVPGKGCVANSLPFYGSYGGVLTENSEGDVVCTLLTYFQEFVTKRRCISSTVILSPFDKNLLEYEACTGFSVSDVRIGQMTELPISGDNPIEKVMLALHSKTRNMVRKAEKLGIIITSDQHSSDFDFLAQIHLQNMKCIGGIAKPPYFFELVKNLFRYNIDYKLYMAWLDKKPIAALLLFYFNGTVEYFTPVIVKEYRSMQPLSLLIYTAMVDAVIKGFKWWNWGGTWLTQAGVLQFKRSWGAIDMPYSYFTTISDQSVLKRAKMELLTDYPYFYVVPFSHLQS